MLGKLNKILDNDVYTSHDKMCDQAFLRYSRQLLLEEIGIEGQHLLKSASVLLVGLGGLGSPAALYLAAAGVGTIFLADNDSLHITNLQRQILYRTEDMGVAKAQLAQRELNELNPRGSYFAICKRLSDKELYAQVAKVDLVLDCSDNIITRHAINAACVHLGVPLVIASAIGFNGQLLVISPPWKNGCYACLFPDKIETYQSCRTSGILGPVVGVMGTLQALEAIKLIVGIYKDDIGRLQLFNGKNLQWRTLYLHSDPCCQVCSVSMRRSLS